MKPSASGLSFVGRFLITASISLMVIGLFRFSISSWFSLGTLYASKNLFLLGYPICWHIIVHSSLLMILCISVVSVQHCLKRLYFSKTCLRCLCITVKNWWVTCVRSNYGFSILFYSFLCSSFCQCHNDLVTVAL